MNARFEITLTKAEFRRWIDAPERRGRRFEWVEGRPVQMANVTRDHADIAMNFAFELRRRLDPDTWAVYAADFKVESENSTRVPDVLVEPRSRDRKARETSSAVVLVEVLSPSSVKTDFIDKLAEYTSLASLEAYVIASQDEAICWLWERQDDGAFPGKPEEFAGRDAKLMLRHREIELPLTEIYRGVAVP